jgi:hypothetical protein
MELGKTAVPTQTKINIVSPLPLLPSGDYRTTPTTDQGYTGHKHNDYIWVVYLGDRGKKSAVPTINRVSVVGS